MNLIIFCKHKEFNYMFVDKMIFITFCKENEFLSNQQWSI